MTISKTKFVTFLALAAGRRRRKYNGISSIFPVSRRGPFAVDTAFSGAVCDDGFWEVRSGTFGSLLSPSPECRTYRNGAPSDRILLFAFQFSGLFFKYAAYLDISRFPA